MSAVAVAPEPPERLDPDTTLRDARDWLRVRIDAGEPCPLCTQFAKVYRRKVTSTMARKLIALYRKHGLDWFHLPTAMAELGMGSRDEAELRYWGLLEEATDKRHDGGRAGWWKITQLGALYIVGGKRIPKYARVFNGRLLGLVGEPVNITQALGTRFSYSELMEGL